MPHPPNRYSKEALHGEFLKRTARKPARLAQWIFAGPHSDNFDLLDWRFKNPRAVTLSGREPYTEIGADPEVPNRRGLIKRSHARALALGTTQENWDEIAGQTPEPHFVDAIAIRAGRWNIAAILPEGIQRIRGNFHGGPNVGYSLRQGPNEFEATIGRLSLENNIMCVPEGVHPYGMPTPVSMAHTKVG